jgi:hypothetical protein
VSLQQSGTLLFSPFVTMGRGERCHFQAARAETCTVTILQSIDSNKLIYSKIMRLGNHGLQQKDFYYYKKMTLKSALKRKNGNLLQSSRTRYLTHISLLLGNYNVKGLFVSDGY